ncbi:lysozyme [Actinokineospora globicatena]|uniref:Lysozyme n=1 Tax=Actinokineospora globicatena TaxID=103729 RepID=A0A9W6QPQ6_9PSEU|nr:lysozyme [Actinokineospora globicatena]MCP2301498.1 lysozyme [Actinokineospora globicatena]GLW76855.1 lysozyme [Actinokineospora globicatena]GLW83688.1 lysozyme [Actinokineospora globicatena]GLW92364.1 lysozyme [Actinokineospora globicatena]
MSIVLGARSAVTAVLCAAATVAAALPSAAAPTPTDHPLGSQIRKHEPVQRMVTAPPTGLATVAGMDVASYQGNVDWAYWWSQGKRFAFVKATEGTGYKNPFFTQQYTGSYGVGMIRGAYHFALPDRSTGAAQATYFATNGGGWSRDGKTLPGVVDLEYNPYGATCYGKTQAAMAAWIRDFTTTYRARAGRDAVIYTSTSWWAQCVGNTSFAGANPLWVARYSSSVGTLPYNWPYWTFWQYTSSPLDQNYFNGAVDRLRVLATG